MPSNGDYVDRILEELEASKQDYSAVASQTFKEPLPRRTDLQRMQQEALRKFGNLSKSASSPGALDKPPGGHYPKVIRLYSLKISIIHARGLRNADRVSGMGTSDAYATCYIVGKGKNGVATKIIESSNPDWNYEGDISDYQEGESLRFATWDHDFGGRDNLGEITLTSKQFFPRGFSGEVDLGNCGKVAKDLKDISDMKTTLKIRVEVTPQGKTTKLQRNFGVSMRPPINPRCDNELGPGSYDTNMVGSIRWQRDTEVSHQAQRQLSNHKSPALISFKKAKAHGAPASTKALLSQPPGPGHYTKPDLWDPSWQRYPSCGTSFVRKPPPPGESRFGLLGKGKHGSGDMLFG